MCLRLKRFQGVRGGVRSASLVAYASRRRCACSSQKVTSPWLIQFFSSSVWQVLARRVVQFGM
jgi:hypothetical protein